MRYVLLSVIFVAGCSILGLGEDDRRHAQRSPGEMKALLGDFDVALAAQNLELAAKVLDELERAIKKADVATITHPDYPQLTSGIDAARNARGAAVRFQEIAAWIEDSRSTMDASDRAVVTLVEDVTTESLSALEHLSGELANLLEQGRSFHDNERQAALAAKLAECGEHVSEARWLLEVQSALARPLERALQADAPLVDIERPEQRLQLTNKAVANYELCQRTATLHTGWKGYADSLEIPSPLGGLVLLDIREQCGERRAVLAEDLPGLEWYSGVAGIAARVSAAMHDVGNAGGGVSSIQLANDVAVDVLERCVDHLAGIEEDPSYDAGAKFDTFWGELSAADLEKKCAGNIDELARVLHTARWSAEAQRVGALLQHAQGQMSRAAGASNEAIKTVALVNAFNWFRACQRRAQSLLERTEPAWADAQPSPEAHEAVETIAERCVQQGAEVGQRIVALEQGE